VIRRAARGQELARGGEDVELVVEAALVHERLRVYFTPT
jgi:hypothetical protein